MKPAALLLPVLLFSFLFLQCSGNGENAKKPPQPSQLSVTQPTANGATLVWKPGADSLNITSYRLVFSHQSGVDSLDTVVVATAGTGRSFTLCNLLPGSTLYFKVYGVDENGLMTGSNEVPVTIPDASPHITVSALSSGSQIDNDNDGYASSYTLSYTLQNTRQDTGTVICRVYYLPSAATAWTAFHADTVSFTAAKAETTLSHITGADLRDSVAVRASVFNQAGTLLSSRILTGIREESNADDGIVRQQFTIKMSLKDSVDFNKNGYLSNYSILYDVDVSSGTSQVVVRLYSRQNGTTAWKQFLRDTITVTGVSTSDRVSETIGADQHETVDILARVTDLSGRPVASDSILGVREESRDDDRVYRLAYAVIDSVYDGDQDHYYSQYRLKFGADMSWGSDSAYAVVIHHGPALATDSIVYQSPLFPISNSLPAETNPHYVMLTGLEAGATATITLKVFRAGGILIDTAVFSVPDETPADDVPVIFTATMALTAHVDGNNNGCYSSWTLNSCVSVNTGGTQTVTATFYYRLSTGTQWFPLNNTANGTSTISYTVSPGAAVCHPFTGTYNTGPCRTFDVQMTVTKGGSVVAQTYYYGLKDEYFIYD
ncbi:MAG TPA: fibronectin type III domain-containing protein [Chitinivibrionales bacterium]|nr:fibronectin type III domain-containing protein [Chitinivibrionales bacterium]